MRHFIRKLSVFDRSSIIRILSIAAGGSGLFYANNNEATVSVSLSEPLRESLPLPWKIGERMPLCPAFLISDKWQFGLLPLFSVSAGSIPSSDENEASAISESTPKRCPGCLGRDSIANAGARVGPAVVNISIHQGMFGIGGGKGIGSGTIIDKDGTILTCAHAVVDFHGVRAASKGKVQLDHLLFRES
ncbi:putative protease Do-like 14 [Morus notabilis]|uniref:putative protease Do-like 14 n=1 Tax=Morus notabilis TaxID=981085 RepID=UPI000CED1A05|nr:putative protease Do-like 14 [Morus notabilis]